MVWIVTQPQYLSCASLGQNLCSSRQEVARVRNRKQEIISQDDLYTLAVEYIKGTTTDTHLELCVSV